MTPWREIVKKGGGTYDRRSIDFSQKFGPFCKFRSLYNLFMHCKVYIWCCIVCVTIFSVHLWIYSVPNGKLSSKLKILYFWPPFCTIWPKMLPFLQLPLSLIPRYPSQSTLFALFHLYNHFYCPFMDLQHSKW